MSDKRLKKVQGAAIRAGLELLALSNHLYGRMGEGALAHMENVAMDTLEAAGAPVSEGERIYPENTSAALDDVVKLATDFVLFLNDWVPEEDNSPEEFDNAYDAMFEALVGALERAKAIKASG